MALCELCDSETPAGARFCPSCGSPLKGPVEEETRRPVTVLFADVVGFTARAERLDPELVRRIMTGYFSAMSEEIKGEGGRLEKFIGDAVMAVFGAPMAHEDDPRRAVRAAARMLVRLEQWNGKVPPEQRLAIRIGINTGDVVFAPGERDLSVTGDAVNVAARLQSAALSGAVLIGERTARAVRYDFDVEEVEPLQLKGKSQPVRAWLLRSARSPDAAHGRRTLRGPFIGREHELDEMTSLFDWVRQERRAALISVVGEPGLGKSRLLREFMVRVEPSARIMTGHCPPAGGAPLSPLREITRKEVGVREGEGGPATRARLTEFVRSTASSVDVSAADLVEALESTLGTGLSSSRPGDLGSRQAFQKLCDGWTSLLELLASKHPLVICIEDLHWADDSLVELVSNWSTTVKAPVLFVCTTREPFAGGDPSGRSMTIDLSPLDRDEARLLLEDLTAKFVLGAHLVEAILERAEGNPFFVEETARSLADRTSDVLLQGHVDEIPDTVQGLILSRFDRLPADARRWLQAAAVVGRDFWLDSLQELLPEVAADALVPNLVEKGFINWLPGRTGSGEPELTFRHILVRDVAYSTLRLSSRAQFHVKTAGWLEARHESHLDAVIELLAHHLSSAQAATPEAPTRPKARNYCIRAARAAAGSFATRRAQGWGDRALELSVDPERLEVLEMLGDICYLASHGDRAWSSYMQALEECDTSTASAEDLGRISAKAALLATRFAGTMHEPVPHEKVSAVVNRALEGPSPNDADKAKLLLSSAILRAENREAGAREVADEALDLARRLDDPDLMSAGIDTSTFFSFSEGRWAHALELASERESLLDRLTDQREALDHFGGVAWASFYLGRYEQSEAYATRCIEAAHKVDAGSYIHGLAWRVCARVMTGRWDQAARDHAELERMMTEDGRDLPAPYTLRAYAAMALCLALQQEVPEAERMLSVLHEARRRKIPRGAFEAHMARALMHRGNIEGAWEVLESDSGGHSGCVEETKCLNLEARCELTAASSRWDLAPDLVEETRAYADEGSFLALPAYADRLAGMLAVARGKNREAIHLFGRSADLFASLGSPWERVRSFHRKGEAMTAEGDREGAAEVLVEIVAVTDKLGWDHQRLRTKPSLQQ